MDAFEVDVPFFLLSAPTPGTVPAAWDGGGGGVALVPFLGPDSCHTQTFICSATDHQSSSMFLLFQIRVIKDNPDLPR